jgi:DNA-binding HxlR family transcriptional regulator
MSDSTQWKQICPIVLSLEGVGERWSILLLREVFRGVHRFDDLQARLGIASNTLSTRLSRLVEAGFLERCLYREHPPRHSYQLSPRGEDFVPVLFALLDFGNRHFAPEGQVVVIVDKETNEVAEPVLVDRNTHVPMTSARFTFASTELANAQTRAIHPIQVSVSKRAKATKASYGQVRDSYYFRRGSRKGDMMSEPPKGVDTLTIAEGTSTPTEPWSLCGNGRRPWSGRASSRPSTNCTSRIPTWGEGARSLSSTQTFSGVSPTQWGLPSSRTVTGESRRVSIRRPNGTHFRRRRSNGLRCPATSPPAQRPPTLPEILYQGEVFDNDLFGRAAPGCRRPGPDWREVIE